MDTNFVEQTTFSQEGKLYEVAHNLQEHKDAPIYFKVAIALLVIAVVVAIANAIGTNILTADPPRKQIHPSGSTPTPDLDY